MTAKSNDTVFGLRVLRSKEGDLREHLSREKNGKRRDCVFFDSFDINFSGCSLAIAAEEYLAFPSLLATTYSVSALEEGALGFRSVSDNIPQTSSWG